MTNKEFSESDKSFTTACEKVGLPNHKTVVKQKRSKAVILESGVVTLTRQASKWRMKKGKAYKERMED